MIYKRRFEQPKNTITKLKPVSEQLYQMAQTLLEYLLQTHYALSLRRHCQLQPNRCMRNGYYRQPIGTEQRPIQRYHRRPHMTYVPSPDNIFAAMPPSAR